MIPKPFWKKVLLLILTFLMITIALAGVTVYAFLGKIQDSTSKTDSSPATIAAVTANVPEKGNPINILLMGTDDGDPDNPENPRRSDTMIVASINPDQKTVNLLSIPRDSKVTIPGRPGYDKITHAFFYGGASLAVRTVEANFHIPINYYVTIDWQAFIKVVDILGGVDLNVEQDMDYEDPYENLSIHLHKGLQHLNGEKAGEYVRFRHDELGDIGRVERQERFLKALSAQMFKAGTLMKLPALITTISNYVQTDMNTYTLIKTATFLKNMNSDFLHAEMLPGDFATIDDLSYWLPNMAGVQQIVNSRFSNQ